ncbi:hypothetical protein, partial [Enterocloster sp.]|uniref:hypothetical protein n=1 Tax=Enterocloster sp. TaxID=2719315 RepID=UPI00307F62EE
DSPAENHSPEKARSSADCLIFVLSGAKIGISRQPQIGISCYLFRVILTKKAPTDHFIRQCLLIFK